MGTFVTSEATPTLFDSGDKEPAPGLSLRSGWNSKHVASAADLNGLKNALQDARAAIRGREYSVALDWGGGVAVGDGSTNDSAAIQGAIDAAYAAGGGEVVCLGKTYRANVTIKPKVVIRGQGRATILKAVAGSNADVIKGMDFDTLTGKAKATGDINRGVQYFGLHNLTIDGDKATQTAGYGIRVWGRSFTWSNLIVQNCKSGGIWTEFTTHDAGQLEDLLESYYQNIKIHGADGNGWTFRGPHDSWIQDMVIVGCTGWAFRGESSPGSYVGGVGGRGWNSWLNTVGSYYFGGNACVIDSVASGEGGTGIELVAGTGAIKLCNMAIGGHATGIILRGTNILYSGIITDISGDGIKLDGVGQAFIDASTVNVANQINVVGGAVGPNIIRVVCAVPVSGTLRTGAVFGGNDMVTIFPSGSITTPYFKQPDWHGTTFVVKAGLASTPTAGLAFYTQSPDAGTIQQEWRNTSGAMTMRVTGSGNLDFNGNANLQFTGSTGTRLGTATTQKMGFWNATPVAQPAAQADASGGATVDTEARAAINGLLAKLRTIGLIAP